MFLSLGTHPEGDETGVITNSLPAARWWAPEK